jgi:small-conductance mechanosensitive channel
MAFLLPGALESMAADPAASEKIQVISALPHLIRPGGLLMSLGVIVAAWLLLRFSDRLVRNLGEVFAEQRLTFQKINTFFHFGVYLAAVVLVVLLSFRVSAQVLAILGGTLAVAFGFALKDLAASVVAGVLMLFDRPFQVGDRVSFGGMYGDVISIGMRSVKLVTLDDNTVTIPNNIFMTNVTSCGNYGVLDMQVVVDFYIGPDEDVDRAVDLIREATATSRYIYLPKPIKVRVAEQIVENHFAIRLRLKAYVLDTTYEKAFETDVTLRVREAFRAEHIRPPAMLHRARAELTGPCSEQDQKVSTKRIEL